MITTRHVAQAAGVSVSTVGRALAGDLRISQTTRDRVQQAADRLGYVENRPARMMRGGSSKLIGLLLPDISNEFYAAIADTLSQCCEERGYLLTLGLARDAGAELRYVRELVGNRADGLVIVPTMTPDPDLPRLLQGLAHVQLLRQVPDWSSPWFGVNDAAALRQATAHLIELGHRDIAYIGGLTGLSTGADRLEGVRQAMAALPAGRDGDWIRTGPPTYDFGRHATDDLLDRGRMPSALISGSIHVTKAVLDGLTVRGLRAPDDLSVIGFGDVPGCEWWQNGLTTIGMPVRALARSCGDWFLDHVLAQTDLPLDHRCILDAMLVRRGSTGRAPA